MYSHTLLLAPRHFAVIIGQIKGCNLLQLYLTVLLESLGLFSIEKPLPPYPLVVEPQEMGKSAQRADRLLQEQRQSSKKEKKMKKEQLTSLR